MALKDLVTFGTRRSTDLSSVMDPIVDLRREVDGLFNLIFGHLSSSQPAGVGGVLPVDVILRDKEMIVKADMPGIKDSDISIKLSGDTLVLNGSKSEKKEETKENYYIMERSFGTLTRAIPLPFKVDPSMIEAELEKGVLTIKIPKPADTTTYSHDISIKKK